MNTKLDYPQRDTIIPGDKRKMKPKRKPAPRRIRVVENGNRATYTFRWANLAEVIGGTIFALIWNILAVAFMLSHIVEGDMIGVLFTSIFLVIGISMIVQLPIMTLNKTRLTLTPQAIVAESYPFRLKTYRIFDTYQISQVLYKQNQPQRNGDVTYSLWIIDHDNNEHCLLDKLDHEKALYLGQRIKNYLDLPSVT